MTRQINYLNAKHEERYNALLIATRYPHDTERTAMFYIIAGNAELYSYVESIYDFTKDELKIASDFGKLNAICTSSKALLKLAIQLYNSLNNTQSVYDTFVYLDTENMRLASEAIRIRFKF